MKLDECWCVSPGEALWKNPTGGCPEDWTFYYREPPPYAPPELECRNPDDKMIYRVDSKVCPDGWGDITEAEFMVRNAELEMSASKGDYAALYDAYLDMKKHQEYLRDAWHWLCKAADGGYTEARIEVAWWYQRHNWVVSDKWEERYTQTLRNLGISPDDRIAYMWLRLAVSDDDNVATLMRETATLIRKTLERYMPDADIQTAKQMAQEWKPGQCPSKEHPL